MPQPSWLDWTDMSAAKLLEDVRASGIEVTVDGEFLLLKAANEPSPEVLKTLREHKSALLHLLQSEKSGWSANEWRDYFEERAAISEFDHGFPRINAEKNAFDLCVQEWLRQHTTTSAQGVCNQCLQPKGLMQLCITGGDVHTPAHVWLHPNCAGQWHEARRDSAIASLKAIGLRATTAAR